MNEVEYKFPMRINKYLQLFAGLSRRQADQLINAGRVTINGKIARLGKLVGKNSIVRLDGKRVKPVKPYFRYIILNKPEGYICSRSGERTVFELLGKAGDGLFYVGRLDVATTGALILTDDGALANLLARSSAPRVYEAKLNEPLPKDAQELLAQTPYLDGKPVKISHVKISGDKVELTLHEGRWREVRRLFAALGVKVVSLHRKSFAGISVDNLKIGEFRNLLPKEIALLREYAGLKSR